ncbi:MAG: GGDEF domain-containing response regulator [Burkholderiales bacterium]
MRILVVDDDAVTRVTLERLLTKRGCEVATAKDGLEAYEILHRDDAPKLAIVDWMMPGMDGLELCRKLRESGKAHYTYLVMLSGRREKEDFITGLQSGADDYVRKPYDIDELHARMMAAQRLVMVQEQLRNRANIDELTGILSRAAILDLLRREMSHASRDGSALSVVMADLDNFKQVNDTYGHVFGDAVLRRVAKLLGARLRPYDAVGRYGGEEFLLVLPGCNAAAALDVAERVRLNVASESIMSTTGPVKATVSLGIATLDGHSNEVTADELILAADNALYRAKRGGRNRAAGSLA